MTLGIGIANACVLDPVQNHLSTVAHAAEVAHNDADEHTASPDKSICLDVCAAEQAALIKVKPLDIPAVLDAMPVLFLSTLIVPVLDQNNRRVFDSKLLRYELPVSIRFSRLTI